MNEVKRKRGGQPGNRNAFKNGVYSMSIPISQKRHLRQAVGLDEIDRQIRVVKLKLAILVQVNPADSMPVYSALVAMAYLRSYRRKLQELYRRSVFILNLAAVLGNTDFTLVRDLSEINR